ncbi:hypothetical protein LSH36_177g02019 [Paralvinella palmiformis]|uniref:ZU5 domain-containing protein n=1 Tax=Paralvinella palmiformis TaxID=53620 RepID=A0AAD9N623_9ANNE|nr:hypothetical protein LSH36_177g02019 [Paralvinella palmiformis]
MLPEIVNETGVAERAKDATRWHHRFIVGSRRNNGTRPNRQGGGLQASPLSSSSHFGIPHLVKLGFGAANRKPVYRYPEVDEPGTPVRDGYPATSGGLHHMVVLGVGSFLGGMLVILLLFSALLLRRKRRQRHRSAEGGFRSPDKVGEPKLGLLRHEVTPANDDVGNELSTTSCSSTSSGSGDTSSHTSDTSHISDTWPPCPDNVVLLTFCDDGDRTREQEASRETGNSAAYHQKLRQEADASLLAWPQEQQQQQQPQYGENPAHAKCSTSRSCSWSDDEHPFSQSSDNGVSSTGSRFLRIEDEALLAGTLPDLLLPSRPTMTERFLHDTTSCTKTVCAEGGIVSCAGGDVVIIIPPGSVQEECRLRVQVNDDTSSCRIEDRAGALILSPVIDVNVLGAEFFHRPITLKIPYRALCSCVNGVLSLRCWHQPSPTWIPTGRTLRNGVVNHYTWPECFSPEPGVPDEDGCLRTRVATYNCFSNVCTIQTNTSGSFCLTSQSREHSASCGEQRLCTVSASHHDNNIRLCVAVGAKYHFDYGETDGVTSKSRIRQINYTICMSDNTASGRQVSPSILFHFRFRYYRS